jgi:hypothetical protein
MKGVKLAAADLSPLAPSTSSSGRRRQAIGPTYTDLQNAMMSADVMIVYLAYPYDYMTYVPIRMDETFATLLARFRVLFEKGMLQVPKPVLNRHHSYLSPSLICLPYLTLCYRHPYDIFSPSLTVTPSLIVSSPLTLSPSLIAIAIS